MDYPPFFAYFEWIMAQVAGRIDWQITSVKNLDYASNSCIIFQRFSVIISDLLFCYGVYRTCQALQKMNKSMNTAKTFKVLFALNYINVGLFMIDNIHFQYNSMMYGLLLVSIAYIFEVSMIWNNLVE
jgi:alpha-1,3-glucosyltransferase